MAENETESMGEVGLAGDAVMVYTSAVQSIQFAMDIALWLVHSEVSGAISGKNGLSNLVSEAHRKIQGKEDEAKAAIDSKRDLYLPLLIKAKDDAIAAINGGVPSTPTDEAKNIPGESIYNRIGGE